MSSLSELKKEIHARTNLQKAKLLMRFFKTGRGEYAEGDVFLGIMVPEQRILAKKFADISLSDTEKLLHSKYHEERLIALFIFTAQFEKGDEKTRRKIFSAYLANTRHINNWDLIDLSAPKIVGEFLFQEGKGIAVLKKLARSEDLWERRIAVLATFQYIKYNSFEETLEIAELLLYDKHDLIHKAAGWMLREVGKRSLVAEENFLKKYAVKMPRTMLRYAIEKFPEEKRKKYLTK
ncbi:MAG: DNA alkylation repair protein [Candidatus Paceibacterota bacterium]|jgi:3-methyladenine DNA glycosylase AlkD